MADESLGMKHITRVPSGYMVRKSWKSKLTQKFFSFSAYGGVIFALVAAKVYRDELVQKYENLVSEKTKHRHNKTGVVGIHWSCHTNPNRPSSMINVFRAQAPSKRNGGTNTCTFSIKKLGLWSAYKMAVEWRLDQLGSSGIMQFSYESIKSAFLTFMPHYVSHINQVSNVRLRQEMTLAICKLIEDAETPDDIKQSVTAIWVPLVAA